MPTLQFKGKQLVQNHHLVVPFHELKPIKAKSVTDKISLHDNVIIHGDNLAALKALLPTHQGKIKCIYIDPPYNTGNEGWVYNDNVNDPMLKEWLGKAVDKEDLTRHDKWLCMMWPRLRLLRELLAEDGVIFISIDDNEEHHIKVALDEIFGATNWVGTVVWKNVTDNNPTNISMEHEYILCYAKQKLKIDAEWKTAISNVKQKLVEIGESLTKKYKKLEDLRAAYAEWFKENKQFLWPLDRYKYIDEGGIYTGSQSVHNPGREGYRYDVIHPETKKPCKQPLMGYRFPEETLKKLIADGKILFGEDHDKIIELKVYARDYEDKLPSVISLDGRLGAYEIREIFSDFKKAFDNPKPSALLLQLISFATKNSDIILDSFAGSGTTAHAVLALNKEDGGSRKFILIETLNYADTITAERVRRVIEGIPNAKEEALRKGLGGTFSYFELGKPVEIQTILNGKNLPPYKELARYAFFMATGEEWNEKELAASQNYIGESRNYHIYLFYQPDVEYLKNTALTLKQAKSLPMWQIGDKRRLIFAPTKYLDQDYLDRFGIDFARLPYEIYQLADSNKKTRVEG